MKRCVQAKSAGLPSPTSISTRMYAPYSSRSARAPSLRGMRAIASVCLEECEHSLSLERDRDREGVKAETETVTERGTERGSKTDIKKDSVFVCHLTPRARSCCCMLDMSTLLPGWLAEFACGNTRSVQTPVGDSLRLRQ
jgi:hypothetical protein